ncbi:MAG: hypothetical protein GXO75_16600 [Calditrichaeota bacterium]|nr:hypothetical protein [Calditrichota bacterium]
MITPTKTLNEINKEAIHVLCQEIGLVNTIRFINQYTLGLGNYTQEREDLFGNMSMNEIIAGIKEMKKEK